MNSTFVSSGVTAVLFWISVGVLFYAYFGYPLLVFILARIFPRPLGPSSGSEYPTVTLLIAAYNEEAAIRGKIRNALEIDYPRDRFQVLVVNDGSSDSTAGIVREFSSSGVELHDEHERHGKMAAISRAIPDARGEIIVFSDANNLYLPETIRKAVDPFKDPAVGGVSGAKVIEQGDGNLGASEGLYWKYESFIKVQETRFGSCTSATGEILAIRKSLYRRPPDNIINDDFYFVMQVLRQGYRLVYTPEAISREPVSKTARDEVKRRKRINAGRYQAIALAGQLLPLSHPILLWQIFSHKFLRPLIPFFMLSAALLNILAVAMPPANHSFWLLGKPWSLYILTLQVLFYGLALLGSRFTGGRKSRLSRLLYLPTFLVNSNLAAVQGLFMYLRGGKLHMWERIERG